MRICLVETPSVLKNGFLEDGHEVLHINPQEEPVYNIQSALEEQGFQPDILLQRESLGRRTLLTGLQSVTCPKIFWSVDTHLNLHWHHYYARLFDGMMTPHVSLTESSPYPLPPVARLAWPAQARPWVPHSKRANPISFVGRMTVHRPLRRWLADLLRDRHSTQAVQDISVAQMLDLYSDTRIIPNEAILRETNFRVLEGAACGCLVLSQEVGADQDALFTPGYEIETYSHGLELEHQLSFFLTRADEAEKRGRRAWERIQREHLPVHRAREVIAFADSLKGGAERNSAHDAAFWLALREVVRDGKMYLPPERIQARLNALPRCHETAAALLGLSFENGNTAATRNSIAQILSGAETAPTPASVLGAASAAALLIDDFSSARQGWYLFVRKHPELAGRDRRPETPAQLALFWSRAMRRAGTVRRPGAVYSPRKHLPETAIDWALLAQDFEPESTEALRWLETLHASLPGTEYFRLGLLASLSLRSAADWRLGLSLGVANLKAFRLQEGMEEIMAALVTAGEAGRESAFFKTLDALDPRGTIRSELSAALPRHSD